MTSQVLYEFTNIFTAIFRENTHRINLELTHVDVTRLFYEVSLCLENEDLGDYKY